MSHFAGKLLAIAIVCSFVGLPGLACDTRADEGQEIEPRSEAYEANDDDDPESCPPEECGFNGVQLADRRFGELDRDGRPNRRGLAIVDMIAPDGRHLMVDVIDGSLVGIEPENGRIALSGRDIAGSAIVVQKRRSDGSAMELIVSIDSVATERFMSRESGALLSYRMRYARADRPDDAMPLCEGGGAAMVVAGERYHPYRLAIDTRGTERWLTLACEGHLLWKAKQMSYEPGRDPEDPFATSVAQRRATLAMLAADYCGTGERFTRPGARLQWQNRAGWMVVGAPSAARAIEAGWDSLGAVCLNEPRLAKEHTRADIQAACGRDIPRCTAELLAASEWITWIP